MALIKWKKARGNIWIKKSISIEIFQDSSWRNDNANVIIRDKNIDSYESALGKVRMVRYFGEKSQALCFAKKYMGMN